MSTTTHISIAERLGQWCGRGWRAYVRGERRMAAWLVSQGMPSALTTILLWAVKLVSLGLLLYVFFWVALLLIGVAVLGRVAAAGSLAQEGEWKWPFADSDELRQTMGYDPNFYNDVSHPDWRPDEH
jgi:hypothetical protein